MLQCVQILSAQYRATENTAPVSLGKRWEEVSPALPTPTLTIVVSRGRVFENRLAEIVHTLSPTDVLLVFHDDEHPLLLGLEKAQELIAQHSTISLWVIAGEECQNAPEWHFMLAAQDETQDALFKARWERGPFVATDARGKTAIEATSTFPALDDNADALLWEWLTESTREDLRFDAGKNLRLFAKNSRLQ